MKKMLLFAFVTCLVLIAACSSPAKQPENADTDVNGDAPAVQGEVTQSIVVIPQTYTDPATITTDASILARADGQVLDWDAVLTAPDDTADSANASAIEFDVSGWPQNEYTLGLPLPLTGKVSMSGNDDETGAFVIMFEGMPYESFLAYIELLKEAGYTKDARTEDFASYGAGEGVMYVASGADGRKIEAMCAMGTTTLSITK